MGMLSHDDEIFGWGLKDHSKYLYHYTTMEIAVEYILKNRTLKIGKLINTNDPKESKSWKLSISTDEGSKLKNYSLDDISEEVTRELKRKVNVICFCKDKPPLSGSPLEDIYKRGFCKPIMWAQYAENHEGLCLVFEKDGLQKAISEQSGGCDIYQGDVHYINRPVVHDLNDDTYTINIDYSEKFGLKRYLRAHVRTYFKRLFFEKMEDWKDEDEYRWVLVKEEERDILVDFQDALKGVMFGVNVNQAQIGSVVQATKEYKLTYEQLEWNNCTPWVTGRINWSQP